MNTNTRTHSPLRWPGGKASLAPLIDQLARLQQPRLFVEPFAGGASVALHLLANNTVNHIHINDLDHGIWALWHTILNHHDQLNHLITTTPCTLTTWETCRTQLTHLDPITAGFATLFINRCARSGILTAGPIGGKNQTGPWAINARWNPTELTRRINFINHHKHRITLTHQDACDIIQACEPSDTLIFADPPYIHAGPRLYPTPFTTADHDRLAQTLKQSLCRWVLTYDNHPYVRQTYAGTHISALNLRYSAATARAATELIISNDPLSADHFTTPSLFDFEVPA